ncbi:HEAT repeat domain-containing protein [Anabaena sp. YBS01]|uniref:HEAT repeat domain-containing protein n=1 Tax=Anabaena sp. YBS01 TaxID=2490939 RepID=UPI001D17A12C|nr:HEAT repeat domain-containing protein [Anabaena sp. YBS01]
MTTGLSWLSTVVRQDLLCLPIAAIPGLLELLKDSESNVRSSAAFALGKIGTEAAIPGLLELLKDSESNVRSSAASKTQNLMCGLVPHLR